LLEHFKGWATTGSVVLLSAAIFLVCLPLLQFGPQTGHDLPLILPWSQYFVEQLVDGNLYPRWLVDMYGGVGAPVFFYYPPVPFYFTSLASLICQECVPLRQLGVAESIIVLCSALSFFWFISYHTHRTAACLGALAYAIAPYHFAVDLLFRQAIGEACSYVWIPLIFGCMDRMQAGLRFGPLLAVCYALLVLTHVPLTLLASPVFLLYGMLYVFRMRSSELFTRYALWVLLGTLIASVYLVPALFTQDMIAVEQLWTGNFDYKRWFLLDDTNKASKVFFSEVGIVGAGFFVVTWSTLFWHAQDRRAAIIIILPVVVICSWFLMTPVSAFLWQALTLLQKVQFPWRLLVLQDWALMTTLSLLLGWGLSSRRFIGAFPAIAIFSLVLGWAGFYLVKGYGQHLDLRSDIANKQRFSSILEYGFGAHEHLPVSVKVSREVLMSNTIKLDRVSYDSSKGVINVDLWRPRDIRLQVDLEGATTVFVKQLYYPGWAAHIEAGDKSGEITITQHGVLGLIAVELPSGRYHVRLKMHPLWTERIGWILTFFGLVILLFASGISFVNGTSRIFWWTKSDD
jgi:hypothetical protein